MRLLDERTIEELDILIKMESDHINRGFAISEELGRIFLSNSLTSFIDIYLKVLYKIAIIPAMSTEYRYFIIGILKSLDDACRDIAILEVLIPSIGKVETEVLLKLIDATKEEGLRR